MWILSILMTAVLASSQNYNEREDRLKELHSRLGLGLMPYVGMPFVGGLPVLEFADGSQIVRLVTKSDFDIAGASLDNYRMFKGDMHSRTPVLRELSDGGRALIFVYRDAAKVPLFMIYLNNMGRTAPGQWSTGFYGPEVVRAARHRDEPLSAELQDKLLAFWLDLGDSLVESTAIRAARALGVGRDTRTLRERIAGLVGMSSDEDVPRWRSNYFTRRHYEEEVPEDEYLDDSVDDGEENQDAEDYKSAVKITDLFVDTVEQQSDSLMMTYDNLGPLNVAPSIKITKGRRAVFGGSTWAWRRFEQSWEIQDLNSAEFLLDTWSYKLILVRREPGMVWLRKHLIQDDDMWGRQFDKLLVYWKLEDRAGERVGKVVPFAEGPWRLLDEALDISARADEEEKDLCEDAAVVATETQRKWLVPVEKALMQTSILLQSRK